MAGLAEAEGVRWYLSDHLGTVRDLADSAGEVIDHIAYDSFGNVLSETSPAAGDRFRFTGREFDAATGQYYYRARYYDGRIGRFTSEDPLGLAAGDVNLYRYVSNRPTVLTDGLGLLADSPIYTGVGLSPPSGSGLAEGEPGATPGESKEIAELQRVITKLENTRAELIQKHYLPALAEFLRIKARKSWLAGEVKRLIRWREWLTQSLMNSSALPPPMGVYYRSAVLAAMAVAKAAEVGFAQESEALDEPLGKARVELQNVQVKINAIDKEIHKLKERLMLLLELQGNGRR